MVDAALDQPDMHRDADAADLRRLIGAQAVRDFGDGFVAVLLPAYLLALDFSAFQVGLFATVALLGSAGLTLGVGLLGNRYEHRQLLCVAALSMAATGAAYALAE